MEVVAGQPVKNNNFFEFPRVSTGAHPLTKKPEDSGYEIGYRYDDENNIYEVKLKVSISPVGVLQF